MRTLSHSIAILQLRSEADEAILKRPHSNWMRALHESTGLPVQERGAAVWRDIDMTYPAYLTGSALNRPSRRAAVYHAFLMQCAYTRNSAQMRTSSRRAPAVSAASRADRACRGVRRPVPLTATASDWLPISVQTHKMAKPAFVTHDDEASLCS